MVDIKANPLSFWESHQLQFPNLSKLARLYLCPPASSTASEREFKVAKSIQTDKRARLLPRNFEKLLFLKYNLRAISYQTDLPSPPKTFSSPNSEQYDTDPCPQKQSQGRGRPGARRRGEEEDGDSLLETASTSTLDLLRDDEEDEDESFDGFLGGDFPSVFSDSEEFELDSGESDEVED